MNKCLFATLMFVAPFVQADQYHYNDCVEIVGGFYASPDEQVVGRVTDERGISPRKEYLIGGSFLGLWLPEKDIKKIDKKVCEKLEKEDK